MRKKLRRDGVIRILEGAGQTRLVSALAERGSTDLGKVEPVVRRIVREVQRRGDRAVRRYAVRWDGLGKREPLRVPEEDLDQAWAQADPKLQDAIKRAAANVRRLQSGKRRLNGVETFSRVSLWGSWCGPWNLWDVMFRAAATRCHRHCS